MTTTKDAPNVQLDFVEIVNPRLWMGESTVDTWLTTSPVALFDVANPSVSWFDLGSIMAVRVPVTKDVFEHKDGLPKTSRKLWEIDRSAQITFNTKDLSPYIEALINGQTVYNTMATPIGAEGSHVASLYSDGDRRRNKVLLASTPISLVQYDIVACASQVNASTQSSYNIAVVDSVTASLLTLRDGGFPVDPALGDVIRKVDKIEFIDNLGSDTVRSALLFWDTYVVSDSIKIQNAIYFPRVRNFSGADTDFKDGAEPYEQSITLSAQAVNMTYTDGSSGYNFYKKFMLQY